MQAFGIKTDDTLRSTVEHGSPGFSFGSYLGEIETLENRCVEWHWHNEFEFTTAIAGTVACLVGTDCVTLEAGDGLFINRGVIHRFESHGEGVLTGVLFGPEFLAPQDTQVHRKFIAPFLAAGQKYLPLYRRDSEQRALLDQLDAIYRTAQEPSSTRELDLHIQAAQLWKGLYVLAGGGLDDQVQSSTKIIQARLRRMLDFIHHQYGGRISLQEIADAAGVSKSEALRCFQAGIGTSPVSYLNEYRLERARERLQSTSETVSAVAWQVGFESLGYFCRAFKKRYRMTPKEFRRGSGT